MYVCINAFTSLGLVLYVAYGPHRLLTGQFVRHQTVTIHSLLLVVPFLFIDTSIGMMMIVMVV